MNIALKTTLLLADATEEGVEFALNGDNISIFVPHSAPQELHLCLKAEEDMIKQRVKYDADHPEYDVLNRFLYQHLYEINEVYASPIQGVFQDYQAWTKTQSRPRRLRRRLPLVIT